VEGHVGQPVHVRVQRVPNQACSVPCSARQATTSEHLPRLVSQRVRMKATRARPSERSLAQFGALCSEPHENLARMPVPCRTMEGTKKAIVVAKLK
jgi:hypothetical protein